MRYSAFFFMLSLQNHCIFDTYNTFQLGLTTFQGLSNHRVVGTAGANTVFKFLLCLNAASPFPQGGRAVNETIQAWSFLSWGIFKL